MRLKLIACKALYREFSLISASSENYIDVTYLRQVFHDTPQILQKTLQAEIDLIDEASDSHSAAPRLGLDFDAIVIGYGLCSNAVLGLSSKKYPIVIPRTDDCIGLLLGSYERYKEIFDEKSGNYWYTPGWIESAAVPSEEYDRALLAEYIEKYDEDDAQYLMSMEHSISHYTDFSYIEWKRLNLPSCKEYAQQAAEHFGVNFNVVDGNEDFLTALLSGNWDERFLIVPPGKKVAANYDGKIIETED